MLHTSQLKLSSVSAAASVMQVMSTVMQVMSSVMQVMSTVMRTAYSRSICVTKQIPEAHATAYATAHIKGKSKACVKANAK